MNLCMYVCDGMHILYLIYEAYKYYMCMFYDLTKMIAIIPLIKNK